jgi:2-polyprenyl-3-methyl-5-hydroxy-6-metoxy-1,4-benzoquinol methylase
MPTLQAEPKTQQPTPAVSPAMIFEVLHRYQHTMALKGAIDLELFTHIAGGVATPAAIADRCQANERGVRMLCDFLTIIGFLNKTGESYSLTRESSLFLDKHSPAYMGSVSRFLSDPINLEHFRDVAALVRKGGPLDGLGHLVPENGIWVTFANAMVPMIRLAADAAAAIVSEPGRKLKVLDIAAGHGLFGITVALRNPSAEVVAVDWKNVLDIATANATRARVQDRFRTVPGDAFEVEFGAGYDLVIVSNFLHLFDAATNLRLLKKVRASLNPGGRLATVEFVPNDDRVSPPIAASFCMNMLANTAGGDVYTLRDLDTLFREAGLGESRLQLLAPTPLALILTER